MQEDASNGTSKLILGASGVSVLVTSSVIIFPVNHVAANIEPSCVSLVGVDTVPALFKAAPFNAISDLRPIFLPNFCGLK